VTPWQAEGVVEDYEHYRRGEAEMLTSAVRDLTGYEGTFFSQFAMDYAGSFSGKAAGKA
jgi:hypothetical protein